MMGLPGNTGSAVAVSGTKNNLYHKFFKAPIQGLNLDSLNYNQAYIIESTYTTGKYSGLTIGVVVDKFGGIYDETGGSVSISDDFMPVSASIKIVTFSNIPNAPESKEAVMTAIQGLGIGVGVTVDHVNMSAGVSPSGDIKNMKDTVHYDVGVSTTHYGIEATGAYTDYVENINDAEIWDSDYNRIIYQYWYNHPEEPLEVYNGPSGHAMLIKRTPFGVLQHKGTTHGDNRDWYINRDFDRYNGRLYYRRVRM